jgi:hypothetical protein
MGDEIINKVALSPLVTLDLEELYPRDAFELFDLKDHLFKGMILKEKDFRSALQETDWTKFSNTIVSVFCSADAIIPVWAYMLVATYLQPVAKDIVFGNQEQALKQIFLKNIQALPLVDFTDKRVVVKGCGNLPVGAFAYLEITKRLTPVVKSIMYGEPCSTVPIYKKK